MEALLFKIILESQRSIAAKKNIKRNYRIPKTDHINVLTGIRRCGKTYTLYEQAKKIHPERVLFIDFEDERLVNLNNLENYDIILDSYKHLYPNRKPVLFFDEIQNLNNWHLYLKRLHVAGYKIYATGSNAFLLSKEIATFLKGRSLETNIYPFSFNEFLLLKSKSFTKKDFIINIPEILHYFDEYLIYGAFPEVIKSSENDKRSVMKNIYSLLFYKDLIVKFDKSEYLMRLVLSKISENITKEFSISSLARKIMPIHKTTIPTVTDYFNILPEPFLTSNVYQYRKSFVHREAKRKTYFTDNSFITLNQVDVNKGKLLENLVFNVLKRKHEDIYYYKTHNNLEVDFFVNPEHERKLIQVSFSLNDFETKQRELRALKKAMKELEINESYIFSYNEEDVIKDNGFIIYVVPVWKYLLTESDYTRK
ncbi:MAG: ATP-binding protein [Bacteroidales bacterium]|nr:ATP-binding protein [Bacteroidales bacterium]